MVIKKDWYEEIERQTYGDLLEESGCCLICASAEDGCLCFNCKCRECLHYEIEIIGEKGFCQLASGWDFKYEQGLKFSLFKIIEIKHETNKAYLCKIEDLVLDKEIWVPKSVVDSEGYVKLWFLWKLGFTNVETTKDLFKKKKTNQKTLDDFNSI